MAICKGGHRISLLLERHPRIGLLTFSKAIGACAKGVCISRLHPDYVAQKFGLDRRRCYWLSGCKGKEVLTPRMLGKMVKVIRSEAKEKGDVVFFDGLEYLLLFNDMARVMAFLEEVDLFLGKVEAEMIVCIDPLTFEQKDLDRLWAAYPQCTPEEMALTLTAQPSQQSAPGAPASVSQTI
jgi:hypothetical protein